jgi:succinate dehydrogenase / fumarate reductase iron-sulfur subunit
MFLFRQKVSHLSMLPQERLKQPESESYVEEMDRLGFGNCSNTGACEAECPKQISLSILQGSTENISKYFG